MGKKKKKKEKKNKMKEDESDNNDNNIKLRDASPSPSPSPRVKLPQTKIEPVAEIAAILDDHKAAISAPSAPSVPSAPPMIDDDEDKEIQQKLMKEAFAKFSQKKQYEATSNIPQKEEFKDDEDVMIYNDDEVIYRNDDDEYKISGPPNQRDGNNGMDTIKIIRNVVDDGDGDVTPPMLGDDDGGGDVTPPITDNYGDNYFIASPSPFVTMKEDDGLNIINGHHNNNKRRVSKAYHGYQPSWAKSNKLHNQFSYYNN